MIIDMIMVINEFILTGILIAKVIYDSPFFLWLNRNIFWGKYIWYF